MPLVIYVTAVKAGMVFSEILRASVSTSPCENLKRVPLLRLCPEDPECTHPTPVLLLGFQPVCRLLPTHPSWELNSCPPHPDMLLVQPPAACARNLGVTSIPLTPSLTTPVHQKYLVLFLFTIHHVCLRSLVLSGLDLQQPPRR